MELQWISGDKWKKRLGELSRRYKETTTTSTPQLTKLGSIFGLLFFLVPIGLAIISSGLSDPRWIASGFVLTLVPPIALLILWLWKRSSKPSSVSDESDDVLHYFVNKQKETTKTETVEAPEPTSVEFQSWFCDLAKDALSGSKKLLIAIDNLDRVAPEDALKLWSSMRAFLDFSGAQTPVWATKLWVLAAFDEQGIRRLWQNAEGDSSADTFLDKTFQIRFRVPPPLLSDWRDFLMAQLKKAFPRGQDSDFYTISQIFAILKAEKKPPTPRDIKVFVNQVGAIFRTSPEDIPLPQQALFAALGERAYDPTKELPEQERLQSYLGPEWKENLVALHYNMPRQKAVQVFLREKVEKAMTEGKPDLLGELAKTPGTDSVVASILDSRLPSWVANEPHVIGRAAYALTTSGIETTHAGQMQLLRLQEATKTVSVWPRLDGASGMGISALVRQANSETFSVRLVESLSASLPASSDKTEPSDSDVTTWTHGLFEILKGLITVGHENSLVQSFKLGRTSQDYVKLVSAVANLRNDKRLWKYSRPACGPREVVQQLEQAASSGTLGLAHERAIEVMVDVECDWPWNELNGPNTRLHNGQQLPAEEVGRHLRALLRLRRASSAAEQTLASIIQNGWLFFHLHFTHAGNDPESIASAVLVGLIYDPEAGVGINQRYTPQGRNTYRALVANPEQQKPVFDSLVMQVDAFWCVEDLLKARNPTGVARAAFDFVFRALASDARCHEIFRTEVVVSYYPTLKSALDEEAFSKMLKASVERGGLEGHLAQQTLTLENSGLYRRVLQIRRSEMLMNATVQGLKSLNNDDWLKALSQAHDVLPLVTDLTEWKVTLGLSYQLQDALSDFADKTLSDQIPEHVTPEICRMLFKALVTERCQQFKKGILEKIITATASTSRLIILFGDVLDCEVLASKADELVREGIRKILDRTEASEYGWVKKILQECPLVLERCPTETMHDLCERIQTFDQGRLTPECKQILHEIAPLCGVKLDRNDATATAQ
jgi:hypothetical protein